MPAPLSKDGAAPSAHIDIKDDREAPKEDGEPSPGLRNSKGWDGKLRVPKSAQMTNPEALSDPEYSDEENVMPGEEIGADEGQAIMHYFDGDGPLT